MFVVAIWSATTANYDFISKGINLMAKFVAQPVSEVVLEQSTRTLLHLASGTQTPTLRSTYRQTLLSA